MVGNLQLISVIEAINFVLLWKGNHLDIHVCKTHIQKQPQTQTQMHVPNLSHRHVTQTYPH